MINRLLPDIHRGENDVNFYIRDGVHPPVIVFRTSAWERRKWQSVSPEVATPVRYCSEYSGRKRLIWLLIQRGLLPLRVCTLGVYNCLRRVENFQMGRWYYSKYQKEAVSPQGSQKPGGRAGGGGWEPDRGGCLHPRRWGSQKPGGRAGGGGSGPGRGDSWKSITWRCTVCVILRLITGWTSTLCHIASNISLSPPWILETISQTGCTPSAVQSAVSSSPSQDSNYNITGREHAACELLSSSPPPYTRNNISEELYPQCHIRTNSIGVFREYYE